MHSSYALSAEDFAVERNGSSEPLDTLWPGGWQPDDRLGVILAQPMDAVGCSNLICGTITLFYDLLREKHGTGNFFRYSDVFLFGVGCEPGDFNQLDVWPLHKFVSILQPSAEAVIEAVNDRRITLLAVPETGARSRGEVVLSTWNTFLAQVRSVVLYSPRTGRARDGDVTLVGNRVVESYVEQAIFSTPGLDAGFQTRLRRLRRNIDREEKQSVETYKSVAGPASVRGLMGVTQVLPPGHQELTRRATPTVIMPVEVAMPPIEATAAPFDLGSAATLEIEMPPPAAPVATEGLLKTAFDQVERRMGGNFAEWEGWDWISDFGDPVAEHHAVREAVGIWDECTASQVVLQGAGCRARGRPDLHVRHGGARSGPVSVRAVLRREREDARRRRLLPGRDRGRHAGRHRARHGCRSLPPRLLRHGRRDRGADVRASAPPGAGAAVARAALEPDGCRRRRPALLPLHPAADHGRRGGGLLGVAHRVLRRDRLRGVLPGRRGRDAVARAARRRRPHGHPAVRAGGGRERCGSSRG